MLQYLERFCFEDDSSGDGSAHDERRFRDSGVESVDVGDNSGLTNSLAMGPSDQFSIIGNIQQPDNLIVHDVVNQRI